MEYVLETNALTKHYRGGIALDGLTMRIPQGAIYGFVGRNGAGKTTLIRLICGLQAPTGGSYTLYGAKYPDPRLARARRRMGAVVETPSIYLGMTAAENLRQQYRVLGLPSERGISDLLRLVGLEGVGRKRARAFSLGMRQRLGIAMALAGHPDFLLLDEPTNGLDPQGMIEMRELILKLNREQGITPVIELPECPVPRCLDGAALRRVFDNLLANAVKYAAGDLRVRLTPDGTVTFTNPAPQLTRVQAARLFDRFFTVETARRSTGLGLSIAKLLTERMGGRIAATYQSGQLTIRLDFPA